jgi:hypothetical protein
MKIQLLTKWLGVIVALSAWASAQAAKETADFALLDFKGRYHHLRQADAKAVVLFFTANGCPIARQCIPRLKKLEKRFEPEKIAFWLVDSNSGDDRESISKEAQEFHVGNRLPVLMDETQGVAAMLGVKRTGTVVCIETGSWTVFYQGAIDDQLVEGAEKPAPTEKYLEAALNSFVAGKPIERPQTTGRGCLFSFGDKGAISYTKQVAPILQNKCFGCHSPGNIGPIKMTNYNKVEGVADMIQEVLLSRRMPPWHADREYGSFVNDCSLSVDESRTLLRWIEQGTHKDEGEDPLVTAAPPTHDWVLGKPDAIVSLPKVEEIPATGVLEYRHIKAPSPFDHDVWLKGITVKPDNTRVVHHLILRAKEHANDDNNNQDDAFLIGWAPGSPEMFFPKGTGKLIKKGAILDFEMHYTTSGREEKDQSSVGLYLLDQKPEMVLKTRAAVDPEFEISPGEATETVFASYPVKRDSLLFDMAPHMHLRGSWFKFEALYPNGKRETLLSVPKYDFKWQHNYRLKEPKRLPAGTWIFCSGGFDNSSRNPANPNPKETVRWGEQSFEEMFIGFMGIAEIPKSAAPEKQLASEK